MDSLDTVKEIILVNSNFYKDFDKCVTLYMDVLKQSDITQSDTRRVLEVSSGGRGGRGGEDVGDCYDTKDDYSMISCDQKGKLKKIHENFSSNSGG